MTPNRFENGEPMLFAGLRRHHSFVAAAAGIRQQWQEFLSGEQPINRVGVRYFGIACASDSRGFEYMCGVHVRSFDGLPASVGRVIAPAQLYAVFSHPKGGALASTWQQILGWLSAGPYESAHRPDFEVYPSAPAAGATSDEVEIWVGVVKRSASIKASDRDQSSDPAARLQR